MNENLKQIKTIIETALSASYNEQYEALSATLSALNKIKDKRLESLIENLKKRIRNCYTLDNLYKPFEQEMACGAALLAIEKMQNIIEGGQNK